MEVPYQQTQFENMNQEFFKDFEDFIKNEPLSDYKDSFNLAIVKAITKLFDYKNRLTHNEIVSTLKLVADKICEMDLPNYYSDLSDEIIAIVIQYSPGDLPFESSSLDDYKSHKLYRKYFSLLGPVDNVR